MRLWNYVRDAMLKHPFKTIAEGKAEMTFEEIVIYSEHFSKKLSGCKSCAILCGSEMAAAIALLSCFAAGVTAVPLSVRYGSKHCKKILDTITPSMVITDMDGELQVLELSDSAYIEPKQHPALIMCTSGTTGSPKGVMLSENNLLANVKSISSYFRLEKEDVILIARPLYHSAVLTGEFLTALCQGISVRFYSESFNPKVLLNLIDRHLITTFCSTPTLLNVLIRFCKGESGRSLRRIVVSGECMARKTGEKIQETFPQAQIYHVYGLTEASPRVSYLPPDRFERFPDSVGIPLKGVSLRILKDDGQEASSNEEGILWVKGDNVMLGYYNDPSKTKKVLQNGWLCTGDIAVLDEHGLLKIRGRKDNLIIRAGMNIYPQEIEKVLKDDARVREVLVYGVSSENLGLQIGMDIVGQFKDVEEVRKLCVQSLPSYQIPTQIRLVNEIAKNESGKLLRRDRYA